MDSTEEFLQELSHIQENLSGRCSEKKQLENDSNEESQNVSETSLTISKPNIPIVATSKPIATVDKEETVPETSTSQLSEYVVDQIKDAVQNGMMTLKDIQSTVSTCLDGKVIKGYADLLNSIVKGLDTINNLNIAKQSANNAKELEVLKQQHKKEILATKNENIKTGNVNVFVGGREALMKILKNQDYTDVTSSDNSEEN